MYMSSARDTDYVYNIESLGKMETFGTYICSSKAEDVLEY
jgi:hypothetical protein